MARTKQAAPSALLSQPSTTHRRPPPCRLQKPVAPRAPLSQPSKAHRRRPPPCRAQRPGMPPPTATDKHASASHSCPARFGFFGGLPAAAVLAGDAAVAWPPARAGLRGCGFAMLPFATAFSKDLPRVGPERSQPIDRDYGCDAKLFVIDISKMHQLFQLE